MTQKCALFGQMPILCCLISTRVIELAEIVPSLCKLQKFEFHQISFSSIMWPTPPRPSEISEKNWSTLTSHLWYKAILKVWRKSWEPFRIYQLTSTVNPAQFHNSSPWSRINYYHLFCLISMPWFERKNKNLLLLLWKITIAFVFLSFRIKYFDFNNFIKNTTNIF